MSKDLGSDLEATYMELKSELESAIVTVLKRVQDDFSISCDLLEITFAKETAVKTLRTGVLESNLVVPAIAINSKFNDEDGEIRNGTVLIDTLVLGDVTIAYQLGTLMSCGLTEEGAVQLAQVISDMTQQIVELLDDDEEDTLYAITPIGLSEARALYLG